MAYLMESLSVARLLEHLAGISGVMGLNPIMHSDCFLALHLWHTENFTFLSDANRNSGWIYVLIWKGQSAEVCMFNCCPCITWEWNWMFKMIPERKWWLTSISQLIWTNNIELPWNQTKMCTCQWVGFDPCRRFS